MTYTNLPKGDYVFRVRSTNSDGVWVDNERILNITILLSFWETPLAYVLYVCFVLLIIFVAVYILFTIYRLKHEVSVEQQISDIKLRFFTNISHELRADMTTSHIPIILLTAKTTIESKLEGLEYGADDYITKPFSATYLQARVENLLIQRKKLQNFYRDSLTHVMVSEVPGVQEEVLSGHEVTGSESESGVAEESVMPEMSPNDRKFMDKLVELMEQNMDNGELVVDDLVRELAVSRSVFFKKLKTLTGLAPIEFIKEMRIKRAAQLIETGEFNMTQISYMVGINDPRYFSKCFKAQVGMTPTEYREKVGR